MTLCVTFMTLYITTSVTGCFFEKFPMPTFSFLKKIQGRVNALKAVKTLFEKDTHKKRNSLKTT